MKLRHVSCIVLAAFVVVAGTGCFARWRRWRDNPPPPKVYTDPVFPGQRSPNTSPEILMPAPNGNGPPALPAPLSSGYLPPGAYVDPRVPPALRSDPRYLPPTRTETPEPPLAPKSNEGVRSLPPDLRDPPRISPPDVSESIDGAASPGLPVGIHAFAEVHPKIASGQRPDLEGLDWLKSNRYRTVVHLFRPGTLNGADRDQVERRGLKYRPFEVSAATLNRRVADEFSRLVNDSANQPIFVYDSNGSTSGAMWYLHFRLAENLSDETARKKAALLGLKESGSDDEATALWLAIQNVLRDSK